MGFGLKYCSLMSGKQTKNIYTYIYIYILHIKAFLEIGTHSGQRTVRILGKSPCKGYTGIDRISRGLGILSQ